MLPSAHITTSKPLPPVVVTGLVLFVLARERVRETLSAGNPARRSSPSCGASISPQCLPRLFVEHASGPRPVFVCAGMGVCCSTPCCMACGVLGVGQQPAPHGRRREEGFGGAWLCAEVDSPCFFPLSPVIGTSSEGWPWLPQLAGGSIRSCSLALCCPVLPELAWVLACVGAHGPRGSRSLPGSPFPLWPRPDSKTPRMCVGWGERLVRATVCRMR